MIATSGHRSCKCSASAFFIRFPRAGPSTATWNCMQAHAASSSLKSCATITKQDFCCSRETASERKSGFAASIRTVERSRAHLKCDFFPGPLRLLRKFDQLCFFRSMAAQSIGLLCLGDSTDSMFPATARAGQKKCVSAKTWCARVDQPQHWEYKSCGIQLALASAAVSIGNCKMNTVPWPTRERIAIRP